MPDFDDLHQQNNDPLTTPFDNIALAFSGGGFRAASFSLGVMSYLHRITFHNVAADGSSELVTLLKKVTYISSASGGTIPNALYALTIANGGDFDTFYKNLYISMDGEAILARALDNLNNKSLWKERSLKTRNIINSFALSYDSELLFSKATVREISTPKHPTHLEEVCFNSTEFFSGLPFRQQIKMQQWPEPNDEYFHYGNHIVCITGDVINDFKLADLLAASSCFPGGFEPIELPNDFCYGNLEPHAIRSALKFEPQTNSNKEKAFIREGNLGLMDGGITDNQGLESLMNADERRRDLKSRKRSANFLPFDLIMVNDVGSFYMAPYSVPKMANRPMSLLTISNFKILLRITMVIGIALFFGGFYFHDVWRSVLGAILAIIPALILIPMDLMYKAMTDKNNRSALNLEHTFSQSIVEKLLRFMKHTAVGLLKQILTTRLNSVMMLTSDVFMKRIRQILYDTFYHNAVWDNRRKGNHIYDLSYSNNINRQNREKDAPQPGDPIQLVAETACNMGTTLWFDENSRTKTHNMASIIACGEFTTCYNLMGYISKLRESSVWNGFEQKYKDRVNEVDKQLHDDWDKFQKDPFFMFNKMGADILGASFKPVDYTTIPFPDFTERPAPKK